MPDAALFAVALGAGLVAAVNPCGFALLPAYLTFLIAGESAATGRTRAVTRAITLSAAMTLGFVAVFGGFGLLAAPAADAVAQRLPWLTVVIGLVLVVIGGWLLSGRGLPAVIPGLARGPEVSRRFGSMVLFGVAYAVASLGCTIGPFLAVVATAGLGSGSRLAGVALFLTYAAGMALLVGTVAVAVALARVSLVQRLRRAAPALARVGAGVLVFAGAYVAWYGWYELRVFAGGATRDPVVGPAGEIQAVIEAGVRTLGAGWLAAIVTAMTATTVLAWWLRRRSSQRNRTGPARVDS